MLHIIRILYICNYINTSLSIQFAFFTFNYILYFIAITLSFIPNIVLNIENNFISLLSIIIIYTILAFITASIVKLIKCIIEKISNRCSCNTTNELSLVNSTDRNCNNDTTAANNSIVVSGNIIPNQCNGGRSGCIRGCYRRC